MSSGDLFEASSANKGAAPDLLGGLSPANPNASSPSSGFADFSKAPSSPYSKWPIPGKNAVY